MSAVISMIYYYFLYSLFADMMMERFCDIDENSEMYGEAVHGQKTMKYEIKSVGNGSKPIKDKIKPVSNMYGKDSKRVLIVSLSAILSVCFYLVYDSIIDIVPIAIFLFIIASFLVDKPRLDKYYFTALFILCVYTTDILINIFSDDILSPYTSWDYLDEVYRYSVEYMIKIFILYVVSKLIIYFFKKRKLSIYNRVYILSILFIVTTMYIYGSFFRNMIGYGQSSSNSDVIAILCILLLIFNIFVHILFESVLKSERENSLLSIEKVRNDMNIRYLEDILERKKLKDSILHDTKRNYSTILHLMESQEYLEAKNILLSLLNDVQKIEQKNYTSNKIMNAIISEKQSKCLRIGEGVLNCDIDMAVDFSVIEDVDLITIFSNALDNAIEASDKIDDPRIDFCARNSIEMESIVVRISNRFDGELNVEKGKIITSKNDGLEHGIGITNIEKTVEKYHGSMSISSSEGVFSLSLIIPYVRG